MKTFAIESTHLNFEGLGVKYEHGWGNGYVIIPPGHPMHGKDYDEINQHVEVHGGLTFSASCAECILHGWGKDKVTEDDKDGWVVGFDTGHAYDTLERWPDEKSVLKEAESLKQQLEQMIIPHKA